MAREKQIEFPPEQSHHRLVTPVMWAVSILCIIIVVIIIMVVILLSFCGFAVMQPD